MSAMEKNEEIVMTAAKLHGNAIMRLERKLKKEIDYNQVHHVAGGPYQGILVNKTATSMDDVNQADGRLEFMAYIHQKQNQNGDQIKDSWTIRFWFQTKPVIHNKNKLMTEYFRELIKHKTKNYIGFVKKALVVLREYNNIKRVELEVQDSQDDDDDDGPIKSFISVFTPESYSYQFVPEVTVSNKTFVYFEVKASQDAHIALSAIYGDVERKTFEIALGADSNMMSYIRDGSLGTTKSETKTPYLLSDEELRPFWISWNDHRIEVGKGDQVGFEMFLKWSVPVNRRFNINCLSVATSRKSKGVWEFTEILDEFEDNKVKAPDPEKEARRAKVRIQILWIAKKQRMLQCLEDAYPNSATVPSIFRQCKIQQSDMISATVVLADLQKRGLIREISDGAWVRIQSEEESNKHEIKIVKELPSFASRDSISIGIITSLYCEKLAVDSMLDNKTTYIIHRTNGISQVYTVGKIGNNNIVSTKLSSHTVNQLNDDTIKCLHEIKIVKELPSFASRDSISIGIITSLYCEKLAVDSMLDNKTTYIIHRKNGISQVYTVGKIGNNYIVSTKLSSHTVNQLNDDTINCLHGNFKGLKHVLLVGVGGAVPSYNDYNKHVRLGDVVVSSPNATGATYINCLKVEKIAGATGYTYTTKGYSSTDQTLDATVKALRQKVSAAAKAPTPWERITEEAMDVLKGQESNFHRPSIRTDQLFYTKPDGTVIQCDHPRPNDVHYRDRQSRVCYGSVAVGRLVARSDDIRHDFATRNEVKCFDTGYAAILDCLEKNKTKSFVVIRGISDYLDGCKKEWQCYASLVAASYMKSLILEL